MNTIKNFALCGLLLAMVFVLQGCGAGDDCDAGTGTFKPLPEGCEKEKSK